GPDQHLLYRLTGDYFAVHADPDFARASGFSGPILHGACTLGYACRMLVDVLLAGEPSRLRRLACRFAGHVYPGTELELEIEARKSGWARWRVRAVADGRLLIDRGECEFV
ncbi:MAG: short-chain dehydrogenase, partial [Deltaproteobacteria bacterium]|nr:short-chain dehydrogenase [Deltaproteobacteria bacterium]